MTNNWLKKLHNEKTHYQISLNEKKLNIYVTRIKTLPNYFNQLIRRKTINYSEGFFFYKTNGIASYLFNFSLDIVTVNWEEKIIYLYENFPPNKLSNYYPNVKFLYLLPQNTIKTYDLRLNDHFSHRKIKHYKVKKLI